jgi:hypothetical protein
VAPGYGFGLYAYERFPTLPPGPLRMALRRATLAPGALLPAPAAGELQVTLLESGGAADLDRQADGSIRNSGPEEMVVYVLVLRSTGAEAATPAADVADRGRWGRRSAQRFQVQSWGRDARTEQ